jgi:hypothetical protein
MSIYRRALVMGFALAVGGYVALSLFVLAVGGGA